MSKRFISWKNFIEIELIELVNQFLWGICIRPYRGYESSAYLDRYFNTLQENHFFAVFILLFTDLMSLLWIYHFFMQTKKERKIRFFIGSTSKQIRMQSLGLIVLADVVAFCLLVLLEKNALSIIQLTIQIVRTIVMLLWYCLLDAYSIRGKDVL